MTKHWPSGDIVRMVGRAFALGAATAVLESGSSIRTCGVCDLNVVVTMKKISSTVRMSTSDTIGIIGELRLRL